MGNEFAMPSTVPTSIAREIAGLSMCVEFVGPAISPCTCATIAQGLPPHRVDGAQLGGPRPAPRWETRRGHYLFKETNYKHRRQEQEQEQEVEHQEWVTEGPAAQEQEQERQQEQEPKHEGAVPECRGPQQQQQAPEGSPRRARQQQQQARQQQQQEWQQE